MKNFGMDLKRALDSHWIGASELAKTAGVTGNAVALWLKCIPFKRKKPLAKSAICEGFFCLLPDSYRLVRTVRRDLFSGAGNMIDRKFVIQEAFKVVPWGHLAAAEWARGNKTPRLRRFAIKIASIIDTRFIIEFVTNIPHDGVPAVCMYYRICFHRLPPLFKSIRR